MKKAKKGMSMRQQLREKATNELLTVKASAMREVAKIAKDSGIDVTELLKALASVNHSKTADHALITQLANRYEAELVKLWNDQQILAIGGDE